MLSTSLADFLGMRKLDTFAGPPNTSLQRTVKSVTPFASAKAAPLSPAAELGR